MYAERWDQSFNEYISASFLNSACLTCQSAFILTGFDVDDDIEVIYFLGHDCLKSVCQSVCFTYIFIPAYEQMKIDIFPAAGNAASHLVIPGIGI